MNRWLGGLWLVGLGCAMYLGGCDPKNSIIGEVGGAGGQGDAEGECQPGEMRPAGDGCNTCTCDDQGNWGCTLLGCAECVPGEMRAANDGCNTCECVSDGTWACTLLDCGGCQAGETRPAADGCNTCVCDGEDNWACTTLACDECSQGEMRLAGDGCNTCQCLGGQWACTMRACDPPCTLGETTDDGCGGGCTCVGDPGGTGTTWECTANQCPEECVPGSTKVADDGCNSCWCGDDSTWGCTNIGCEELVCDETHADCDASAANGCETDLANSVMNCGLCGYYCAFPGAEASCEDGECVLDRCLPGAADCNGDPADGCEAPTTAAGCDARCDAPADAPEPGPSSGDCDCPEGTACVRDGVESQEGEFCVPIPEACPGGFANCTCMAACVCGDTASECRDVMSIGGMIIDCQGLD
jgi:hypothetical protein